MYLSNRVIFQSILILSCITSCSQDPMIRINSISLVKLVASQEIRYKSCGDSPASCQEIFKHINNKKDELMKIARTNHEIDHSIYLSNKYKIASERRFKELDKCNTVVERFAQGVSVSASRLSQQGLDNNIKMCKERVDINQLNTSIVSTDESYSKPTEEEIREITKEDVIKITKEVIVASLNEYTFSKSDGSIVIICPTLYCAIASYDGAWIGLGERNKPNELTSLILN
jgi:hypothetical protein